jgi:hypothetical protein
LSIIEPGGMLLILFLSYLAFLDLMDGLELPEFPEPLEGTRCFAILGASKSKSRGSEFISSLWFSASLLIESLLACKLSAVAVKFHFVYSFLV